MSITITIRPLVAGSIPETDWRDDPTHGKPRWVVLGRHEFHTPPRVLIETDEAGARALAGLLYQEVEVAIRPKVEPVKPAKPDEPTESAGMLPAFREAAAD